MLISSSEGMGIEVVACMGIEGIVVMAFMGIEVMACMGMEEVQVGFLYELVVEVLLGGGIKIVVFGGALGGLRGSVLSSSGKRHASRSGGFGDCVVVDRCV